MELAEAKLAGETISIEAVRDAIAPMIAQPDGHKMDVIVLACTHFPLLAYEIAATFPNIAQVDGGPGIARRIAHLTKGQPWPTECGEGIIIFTGEPRAPLLGSLARYGLGEVQSL